jgi:hypothetical protein
MQPPGALLVWEGFRGVTCSFGDPELSARRAPRPKERGKVTGEGQESPSPRSAYHGRQREAPRITRGLEHTQRLQKVV